MIRIGSQLEPDDGAAAAFPGRTARSASTAPHSADTQRDMSPPQLNSRSVLPSLSCAPSSAAHSLRGRGSEPAHGDTAAIHAVHTARGRYMAIPQRTLTKIRGETYTQTSRRSRKALWNMRKNTAAAPYVEQTTTHMQFCTTYACQYILLIDRFAPTRPSQTGQTGRFVAVGWDAWDGQSGRGATSGSDGSSGSDETLG